MSHQSFPATNDGGLAALQRSLPRFFTFLVDKRLAVASIIVIWLVVRIYPIVKVDPMMSFEIWQGHKLFDYGFLERRGATLGGGFDTGTLPNPAAFNYTHHPFPIMDLYALIIAAVGAYGVVALMLTLKLATCVLVFLVLDRCFSRFSAWFATILFAVAPCSVLLKHEIANATTLVASLWPLGVFLLLNGSLDSAKQGAARGRFIGTTVFLAGQTDWFFLTIIPPLLVLIFERTGSWWNSVVATLKKPVCVRLLAGTAMTLLVFSLQVILYEPDFRGLHGHLAMEAAVSSHAPVSRSMLFGLIGLRLIMFIGVPLLIGLAAGALLSCRCKERSRLIRAALVFIPVYAVTACLLPQYFVRESSVYSSLLFPATVLTALALENYRRWLAWVLAALCVPGIVEIHLYTAIPEKSATAVTFGQFFAASSAKRDVILTNIDPPSPPYKGSDVMAVRATRIVADRLIFFAQREPEGWKKDPNLIKLANAPALFVFDKSRPSSPDLQQYLHQESKLLSSLNLEIPPERLGVVEKVRSFIFYTIMRKEKAGSPPQQTSGAFEEIEIYRIK